MRLIPVLAASLAVASLAACTTPEERASEAMDKYAPYCKGLGFKSGTDAFANCIQKEQARGESVERSMQVMPMTPKK